MMRMIKAIALILILQGCTHTSSPRPITQDQALAIARKELAVRGALPDESIDKVNWEKDHWVVIVTTVAGHDSKGKPLVYFDGHKTVLVSTSGEILALLNVANITREELIKQEDTLRRMHAEDKNITSQPTNAPYSSPSAGSKR